MAAEEAIYADRADPLVNCDAEDLRAAWEAAGLTDVSLELVETSSEARITPAMLARWFNPAAAGERPAYSQRLAASLDPDELAGVQALYERTLAGATMPWRTVIAHLVGRRVAEKSA